MRFALGFHSCFGVVERFSDGYFEEGEVLGNCFF